MELGEYMDTSDNDFSAKRVSGHRHIQNVFIITQCRLTYTSSYVSNYKVLHVVIHKKLGVTR